MACNDTPQLTTPKGCVHHPYRFILSERDMMRRLLPFFLVVFLAMSGSEAHWRISSATAISSSTRRDRLRVSRYRRQRIQSTATWGSFSCGTQTVHIRGYQNCPVHPLEKWVARGDGGHYVVERLRDTDQVASRGAIAKLRQAASRFQGKPYDLTFEWSDDRIYCSELVWKILRSGLGVQVGRLQKLREFDLSDVAVKAKMKERYGKHVPMEEPVISPGEMFSSETLKVVAGH